LSFLVIPSCYADILDAFPTVIVVVEVYRKVRVG